MGLRQPQYIPIMNQNSNNHPPPYPMYPKNLPPFRSVYPPYPPYIPTLYNQHPSNIGPQN